jgi:hypothetical protein
MVSSLRKVCPKSVVETKERWKGWKMKAHSTNEGKSQKMLATESKVRKRRQVGLKGKEEGEIEERYKYFVRWG